MVDAIVSVSTRIVLILVAVEIIIDVVFKIVIIVIIIIVVVVRKGPTHRPIDMIIIVGDDEANGPIISDRGLGTAVVVTIAVVMVIK